MLALSCASLGATAMFREHFYLACPLTEPAALTFIFSLNESRSIHATVNV